MKKTLFLLLLILSIGIFGCGKSNDTNSSLSAKDLLNKFLEPNANYQELTTNLKPTDEDYTAYFDASIADKAKTIYGELWSDPNTIIAPKEGQTELLLFQATTEEIKNQTGSGLEFPGGYTDIIDKIKPNQTIYRFKFVKPGETLGMAFDGLVNVNGHWTIFPKPWNILE